MIRCKRKVLEASSQKSWQACLLSWSYKLQNDCRAGDTQYLSIQTNLTTYVTHRFILSSEISSSAQQLFVCSSCCLTSIVKPHWSGNHYFGARIDCLCLDGPPCEKSSAVQEIYGHLQMGLSTMLHNNPSFIRTQIPDNVAGFPCHPSLLLYLTQ